MTRLPRSAAALLLLASTAVWAQDTPAPATPAAATAAPVDDEDVVTCENESVTGSRVKKRTVCSTAKQRQEERERTGDALDNMRMGTVQRSNGS